MTLFRKGPHYKIVKKLGSKGVEVLTPETFYVLDTEDSLKEGEIEHAAQWAAALVNQVQA